MRIYEGTQEAANERVCTLQTTFASSGFDIEQVKRETVLLVTTRKMDASIESAIHAILGSDEPSDTGLVLHGSN